MLKGKPIALFVMDYGLFKVHQNGRVIGICGYLVKTDAGERVLIDTGFPQKYADDAVAAAKEDGLGSFGEVLALDASHMPSAQLALCGLTVEDIDLLVITHGHIDHVGHIAGFAGVPIVMGRAERALPRPSYFGAVQPMEWPEAEYALLDQDTQIGPGFEVLMAPGHAPGQLAFMLNLPQTGAVLLTSDAISRPEEVDERFDGTQDFETARASAARILGLAAAQDAMVIYGHCPAQWPGLRKAPNAYR
jgi:N-acyl homoserine lactone hydrolase